MLLHWCGLKSVHLIHSYVDVWENENYVDEHYRFCIARLYFSLTVCLCLQCNTLVLVQYLQLKPPRHSTFVCFFGKCLQSSSKIRDELFIYRCFFCWYVIQSEQGMFRCCLVIFFWLPAFLHKNNKKKNQN